MAGAVLVEALEAGLLIWHPAHNLLRQRTRNWLPAAENTRPHLA